LNFDFTTPKVVYNSNNWTYEPLGDSKPTPTPSEGLYFNNNRGIIEENLTFYKTISIKVWVRPQSTGTFLCIHSLNHCAVRLFVDDDTEKFKMAFRVTDDSGDTTT